MDERARKLVLSSLDRALALCRIPGEDVPAARQAVIDWGLVRAHAARTRRDVFGGLGVVVPRPGRAELRPFELVAAGPGEVTVETLASAISTGTERAQWLRLPNARPGLPFAPGYSGAGRVLSAGAGVQGLAAGSAVAVLRARHASVMTVPAEWVVAVPAGVDLHDAAFVYLAVIAGYGVRRAGPIAGEPVCVVGAGPIGALAHRMAMLEDPGPVTVVATSRRREDAAMRAGAARFETADGDLHGIEAAAVIEATGDPQALRAAVAAARPGATVVLLGSPRGITWDVPLDAIRDKGLRLVGAHVSAMAIEARRASLDLLGDTARRYLGALAGRRLNVDDLAGESIDPREINLMYRRLGRHELDAAHLDWSRVPREGRVRRPRLTAPPRLFARAPAGVTLRAAVSPRATAATARPLRFAVIGCGDIGFANARAIAGAAGAELALAYDVAPELADAVTARFGGSAVRSPEEAMNREHADAVFLSVPHDLHVPLAIQAAEAGLHVVVEKPLAIDLAGGEAVAAAAEAAGVALSVCYAFRYYEAFENARRLVRAGALGVLRGATVLFHTDKPDLYWSGGFSGRARSDWRASRTRAGGGVLIMNLTHYVDVLRHVAGAEPAWVAGVARTQDGAEVEDAIALSIGFEGGAIGTFSGSASTRGAPGSRFEVWGDAGTIILGPVPAIYTERALEGVPAGEWCELAPDAHDDERRIFVERFAGAVRDGRPPDVTAGDALAVQAFVDAAYRAIESGQPVTVQRPVVGIA